MRRKKNPTTLDFRGPAATCVQCGYELHATTGLTCPECGAPRGYYVLIPPCGRRALNRINALATHHGLLRSLLRSKTDGPVTVTLARVDATRLAEAAVVLASCDAPFDLDRAAHRLRTPEPPAIRAGWWLLDHETSCPACGHETNPDRDREICPACDVGLIRLRPADARRLRRRRQLGAIVIQFIIWGTVIGFLGLFALAWLG